MLEISCKEKVLLCCYCLKKVCFKETVWVLLTKMLAAISLPGLLPSLMEEGEKKEVGRDNKG
jgi:hypothetical protein